MPGLELIGPIAGCPQTPSPDPEVARMESAGLFVAADATTMRSYGGAQLGWRWLCRAQGPLIDRVQVWPEGPNGGTAGYFTREDEARQYYGRLRQHAMAAIPHAQVQDTRASFPLHAKTAYAESFWEGGQEVMRLLYDNMPDLSVYLANTDGIGVLDAYPGGPPIASYASQNQVLYLAVARAPSGAVEHVVIVFSDRHQPTPTITDGLPRAEWVKKLNRSLVFPTNVLVVQWGRLSGLDTLASEDAQNPAASIAARMQGRPVIALATPPDIAARLGNVPAAYAIRLEPGSYATTYHELMDTPYGGFSCCAISREGAPSFMPVVLGNAGGVRHGGLTVEQYAMLSEERDAIMMREGAMSPSLGALCQRYGVQQQPGMRALLNGRIDGWELMIQGDPSFSAQWVIHRAVARMRLQGVEPTPEQIAALGQQQAQLTASIEQNHQKYVDKKAAQREAALHVIGFAAGKTWEEVTAEAKRVGPDLRLDWILYDALKILENPGEDGNPKFDQVDKRTGGIAKAHWHSMDEHDRRTEKPTAEKYAAEKVQDIYPKNGLKAPGFFAWLGRLSD